MKLLTLNIEDKNFISLAKAMADGKGDEVLFVDWIPLSRPKTQNSKAKTPIKNIDVVKSTPNDVRLVIFDRYSILTREDVDIYLKRKAILLEPVLRPRPGFLFMPYWINRLDLPLSIWDKKRKFHTGYKGDVLRTDTDSMLVKCSKAIEGVRIGVSSDKIPESRYNILKEIAEFGDFPWDQFYTTILTGSYSDYQSGALPDIRNHLKYGVLPLISSNYKWYHALFKNFIMLDTSTMIWYHKMCRIGNYGFIDELYQNIGTYMPEMFTENFIQTIISLCKS